VRPAPRSLSSSGSPHSRLLSSRPQSSTLSPVPRRSKRLARWSSLSSSSLGYRSVVHRGGERSGEEARAGGGGDREKLAVPFERSSCVCREREAVVRCACCRCARRSSRALGEVLSPVRAGESSEISSLQRSSVSSKDLYSTRSNGKTSLAPFGVTAMTLYCEPMPPWSTRRLAALSISLRRSSVAAPRRRPARRGWRPSEVRKRDWGSGPCVEAVGEGGGGGGSESQRRALASAKERREGTHRTRSSTRRGS